MTEERVSALALAYIHSDMKIDSDVIISKFAVKNRRLKFNWCLKIVFRPPVQKFLETPLPWSMKPIIHWCLLKGQSMRLYIKILSFCYKEAVSIL